jgi:plasmid stabilization system protein ParE
MMVRYRSRAQDDIENIYDRIARENPPAAQRVESAIRRAGELLSGQPELGVAMGHRDARRWPMPDYDYAIFYRINWDEDVIDVLRVVEGRRVRNLKRVPR